MKAVLCKEYGPPEALAYEDVPEAMPGKGEVVIGVKAASVNFPDWLIIQNLYQFKPGLPFSPGGEAAGIVTKVGDGVSHVKVGDRVIAGSPWGSFREEVVCQERACIPMPDEMAFDTGAAFFMAYGTSHYALRRRANIQPGETLLVMGAAGGVGLAAVQLGAAMGAKVIAAASSEEKLELCRQSGASETILYPADLSDKVDQKNFSNQIKSLTGGSGADVIYDPVGSNYAEPALRAMNWNGRYLVVGFAAGGIPQIPLNLPLLKGASVVGVFWGGYTMIQPQEHQENVKELLQLFAEGKINPKIAKTYPMSDAAIAIREIGERKAKGKIILTVD